MSDPSRPRVRYAPSPTGFPHVGNIHTALFNWLFARHSGGTFMLRIEDTDQDRTKPGSLEAIYDSLRWLGLDWDEGPEVGGPFAPYFQSERLPIYQKYAQQLIDSGHAYRCYCSAEQLEADRQAAMARKEAYKYVRRCRYLPEAERAAREASGQPSVVRLAMPETGETRFHDLFRGEIVFQNALIDDQVLLKSNGWPTYHLAAIVDDHLMEITHVLRGDDWISSAPKTVLVHRFLGWEPPLIGHLPLLLSPNKAKLGKRTGAPDILDLRDQGYLPDAVVNFLALLGWAPDDKTEILPRPELIRRFDLGGVGTSPAIYQPEKLDWMNGYYIRQLSADEMVRWMTPPLQRAGLIGPDPAPARDLLERIVPLIQERIKRFDEVPAMTDFFFRSRLTYDPALLIAKGWTAEQTLGALRPARAVLAAHAGDGSFDEATLEPAMRELATQLNAKTQQLFGALRVALTGRTVAPPLFQTMAVLGSERTIERVDAAIDLLAKSAAA